MIEYKHTITLQYERSDGTVTHIVRVTNEERNLVHLLDNAVSEFKEVVIG